MDQIKIGAFLKELRKEKVLTQENFAEHFNVSSRTVSRWENGNNMPDLSLLVEIADYYNVEIREIIDGERKSENMNELEKETFLKVADYSNEERGKLLKRMHGLFIAGLIGFVVAIVIGLLGLDNISPYEFIASFGLGLAFGMMIIGVIFTSRYALKIRAAKMRLLKRIKNKHDRYSKVSAD